MDHNCNSAEVSRLTDKATDNRASGLVATLFCHDFQVYIKS